eukprot:COSAG01_NODE_1766_length_9274_cov_3.461094_7_plen_764_part_01
MNQGSFSQGTWATFDYQLHPSGQFSGIQSRWVHIALAVVQSSHLKTYNDGQEVPDTALGYPATVLSYGRENAAYPHPGQLVRGLAGFQGIGARWSPIYIGGKRHLSTGETRFDGSIAGLFISPRGLSANQVQCLYNIHHSGSKSLPLRHPMNQPANPTTPGPPPSPPGPSESGCPPQIDLKINFIGSGDTVDHSGYSPAHRVTLFGGANITADGLSFNGQTDHVTIGSFPYYSDETFTIAFWMTKEQCTGHIYEYLYSHNQDLTAPITSHTNSNVNMYIGCDNGGGSGHTGGWSTINQGQGGTALRYNLVDKFGTWANFDFPLHDAGDFDSITNLWVHVVLVVSADRLVTYDDGAAVSDTLYGYYSSDGTFQSARNTAYPHPGALSVPFGAFELTQDIFLGTRSDQSPSRRFLGRMAALVISHREMNQAQVACTFRDGESIPLPVRFSGCVGRNLPPGQVGISFLGTIQDSSGHNRTVVAHGGVVATFSGARFNDAQDYVTVPNFQYESVGRFSVSFWMTKEQCAGGVYEYMYSHMSSIDPRTMWTSSGLNMYLGCDNQGHGSSLGGAVIRYLLVGTDHQEALFDTQLHAAGNFDAVTNKWVHVILAVTQTSIKTYDDGRLLQQGAYGFYTSNPGDTAANIAHPNPGALNGRGFGGFVFSAPNDHNGGDLILGGRADHDANRYFRGKLAELNVFQYAVSATQAYCLFRQGDSALPDPHAIYQASACAHLVMDIGFIGDIQDRSGNHHNASLGSANTTVDLGGVH